MIDENRMVNDATKSGLNEIVWIPWFSLLTIDSELRVVKSDTYMYDFAVGEIILNFMLHPEIRSHVGVDSTHFILTKWRTIVDQ